MRNQLLMLAGVLLTIALAASWLRERRPVQLAEPKVSQERSGRRSGFGAGTETGPTRPRLSSRTLTVVPSFVPTSEAEGFPPETLLDDPSEVPSLGYAVDQVQLATSRDQLEHPNRSSQLAYFRNGLGGRFGGWGGAKVVAFNTQDKVVAVRGRTLTTPGGRTLEEKGELGELEQVLGEPEKTIEHKVQVELVYAAKGLRIMCTQRQSRDRSWTVVRDYELTTPWNDDDPTLVDFRKSIGRS